MEQERIDLRQRERDRLKVLHEIEEGDSPSPHERGRSPRRDSPVLFSARRGLGRGSSRGARPEDTLC